jgi:hypothetical protein
MTAKVVFAFDRRLSMKHLLTVTAVLLIIHGIVEAAALLAFVSPSFQPSFVFEELSRNWKYAIWIGVISGCIRILAAVGILACQKWGWALAIVISVTTLLTLTLYLPFGIMDALLAWPVMILLIVYHYKGARTDR